MSHDAPHPDRTDGRPSTPPPVGPRAWVEEPGQTPGMWDKRANVDRLLRVFYALCAIAVILDLVVHRHVERSWEGLFGFYAVYGFASFWILVAVAKRLRKVLMRPEDYYDVD